MSSCVPGTNVTSEPGAIRQLAALNYHDNHPHDTTSYHKTPYDTNPPGTEPPLRQSFLRRNPVSIGLPVRIKEKNSHPIVSISLLDICDFVVGVQLRLYGPDPAVSGEHCSHRSFTWAV